MAIGLWIASLRQRGARSVSPATRQNQEHGRRASPVEQLFPRVEVRDMGAITKYPPVACSRSEGVADLGQADLRFPTSMEGT